VRFIRPTHRNPDTPAFPLVLRVGIHAQSLTVLVLVILLAGLVYGPREAKVLTVMSISTVSLLYLAELFGWLGFSTPGNSATTPVMRFFNFIALFIGTGWLISAYSSLFRQTFDALHAANQSLQAEITERMQTELALRSSEARHRALVESSPFGILVHQHDRLVFVNPAAVVLLGATAAGELLGRPIMDFIHPDSRHSVRERVQAIRGRGESAPPRLQKFVRLDGSVIDVEIQGAPVSFQGAPAVQNSFHDVTERRQAEEVHASLEAQLRESQKMEAMGILAGGIAHDFNNIIATIMGNTMLAKTDLQARPEDTLVSLEEIDKAAQRAKDLVQQILIFSRKGGQTLTVQPVRPPVEEAIKLLRSTIPAGVEFVVTYAETPLYASVDSTQIGQVLINLCANACHAMKDSAGRIEIELAEVWLDHTAAQISPNLHLGQYVRMSVRDNGSGMDEATRARVFEPFFTTKGVGVGTGLGLSVVHGIVRTHQGAITVESAPGKGTTFAVYLPAVAAPAEAERVAEAAPFVSAGQGKRVLYVDDDESLVLLVPRVLQRLGYHASGYLTGQNAVDAVRAAPDEFDLVVSDYNMPGVSGLDVATEVRSIRPDLPVVIFSGYVTDQLRADALQAGVREVISKANTVDDLCQSIHRLLSTEA